MDGRRATSTASSGAHRNMGTDDRSAAIALTSFDGVNPRPSRPAKQSQAGLNQYTAGHLPFE